MPFADLLMQVSVDLILPSIGALAGLVVVGTLIWNASKNNAKTKLSVDNLEERHEEDVKRIEKQFSDDRLQFNNALRELEKDIIQKIADARTERKEEIQKALLNSRDEFNDILNQISGVRSDMKDASTRITTLDTKVNHHAEALHGVKADMLENRMFTTNRHERLEDIVRKEADFVKDTIVEFFSRERSLKNQNHRS